MNHHASGTEPSPSFRAACGNPRDNAVVAMRAGVKTLVLTHLTSVFDSPDVRSASEAEMRQVFSGQVIWGTDLMEVAVGGGSVDVVRVRRV